ncbi:hypothetical protein [Planctomicrobium sp. SH664]|uniref:hypothetical protein n=1 Tax=Planctomicrobium sp. SH664 TaxID=3448125 RepID=UPI003F5B761B
MFSGPRLTMRCLLVCLVLGGAGCPLWTADVGTQIVRKSPLPPILAPREAIELEVYFVDRPIGDPLIGEGLWSSLIAISSVTPAVRESLTADGFRFALSPSRPPRPLQSLMEMSRRGGTYARASVRRYTVQTGQETLLVASEVPNGTPLVRRGSEGVQTVELNSGKCILRIQADRIEDGWSKLVMIPEIHHGEDMLRPQANDLDWTYQQGQRKLTFHEDRLSAEVNTGEMLVIGLNPDSPDALASHFFRSDVSQGMERLVLIRVADMRKIEGVRTGE